MENYYWLSPCLLNQVDTSRESPSIIRDPDFICPNSRWVQLKSDVIGYVYFHIEKDKILPKNCVFSFHGGEKFTFYKFNHILRVADYIEGHMVMEPIQNPRQVQTILQRERVEYLIRKKILIALSESELIANNFGII